MAGDDIGVDSGACQSSSLRTLGPWDLIHSNVQILESWAMGSAKDIRGHFLSKPGGSIACGVGE